MFRDSSPALIAFRRTEFAYTTIIIGPAYQIRTVTISMQNLNWVIGRMTEGGKKLVKEFPSYERAKFGVLDCVFAFLVIMNDLNILSLACKFHF